VGERAASMGHGEVLVTTARKSGCGLAHHGSDTRAYARGRPGVGVLRSERSVGTPQERDGIGNSVKLRTSRIVFDGRCC
jgi:hypothetical protein